MGWREELGTSPKCEPLITSILYLLLHSTQHLSPTLLLVITPHSVSFPIPSFCYPFPIPVTISPTYSHPYSIQSSLHPTLCLTPNFHTPFHPATLFSLSPHYPNQQYCPMTTLPIHTTISTSSPAIFSSTHLHSHHSITLAHQFLKHKNQPYICSISAYATPLISQLPNPQPTTAHPYSTLLFNLPYLKQPTLNTSIPPLLVVHPLQTL